LVNNFFKKFFIHMQEQEVKKILKETETGYDKISQKFSNTRSYIWQDLLFIKSMNLDNYNVLDFGCGNGRLTQILKGKKINNYLGVDVSNNLIRIAKKNYGNKKIKFLKIDRNKKLELPKNHFDVIFLIAVLHHIPSKKLRLEKLRELNSLLKPGGKVIVTVWNLYQKKYLFKIFKSFFKKNNLEKKDIYIPFKTNEGKIFNRYHHAFSKRELENIFQKAGFKTIEIKKTKKNLIYIGKK